MKRRKRFLLLTSLSGIVLCLLAFNNWFPSPPLEKSVRVLYLIPEDREFRDEYKTAIEKCVLELQQWYAEKLDGKTVQLNSPMVEVMSTPHVSDWYHVNIPPNLPEEKLFTVFNTLSDASYLLDMNVVGLQSHPLIMFG